METTIENRIVSYIEQHQTTRAFFERNAKAIVKYVLKPACVLVAILTAYIIYDGLNNLTGLARTGNVLFATGVGLAELALISSEIKKIERRKNK